MFESIATYTPLLIPAFLLLDYVVRNRRYQAGRFWRTRALAVTVAIFFWTGAVAAFWGDLFGDFHLFDLSGLGIAGGTLVGVLVYELFHYGYHRAVHEWDFLWRLAGHQVHHSAESLDAFGANYLHPIDAAMFATFSSVVFIPLLGLGVESAILGALFLLFNAMFQHANIATPHWLGYVIQRPESHNIHHGRGVHRYNYADLPVIDWLFGTLRNPCTLEDTACGFYEGASARLPEMLIGRDVSRPADDESAPAATSA
jgi:sterol desaturase/sphingolipid hydroxylase (fatty acid hydroxylase superfamily)